MRFFLIFVGIHVACGIHQALYEHFGPDIGAGIRNYISQLKKDRAEDRARRLTAREQADAARRWWRDR